MSYDPRDASDFEAKGQWYPSEKQRQQKLWKRGPDPGRGDDPLWCVTCQKRFTSHGVFKGHITGKKHIGALRKAGNHALADEMKGLGETLKAKNEMAKAQETATVKRSRPALPGGAEAHAASERDKKVAKACFQPGKERAAQLAVVSVDAPPVQLAIAGAAAPKQTAAPNGLEWWKGVPTVEKDPDDEAVEHMSALEQLIVKSRAKANGETRGAGDWQCTGNYRKKNGECGAWNFRSRQTCFKCGAQKRLGT